MRAAMPWPSDLLQQRVADRDAAGDGEMRADRARELEKAEQARPSAVNFRDASHQHDRLTGDEKHVEQRARADGGDDRHALGGVGDLAPRLFVERRDEIALGEVDEIASVDDLLQIVDDQRARAAGVGAIFIELAEFAERARAAALPSSLARASASAACSLAMRFCRPMARTSRATKSSAATGRGRARTRPIDPENSGVPEQVLDQIPYPEREGERDEPAERR